MSKTAQNRPIKLYPWAEMHTLPQRRYLIKGLLDEGGMSVVYGPSNSGKTFLVIDMAAHISLGWNWRDRKTKQGSVVYIAAEGGLGLFERLKAFEAKHWLKHKGSLYVYPGNLSLIQETSALQGYIKAFSKLPDLKLVIVDTLARAMGAGNENSSEDMGAIIRNCDHIRECLKCHVMLVHHSGKDASKGGRGHSSLKAAIDTEISVEQDNGIITAKLEKQRDGETGITFSFALDKFKVGEDEDSDPIISCALEPSETPSGKQKKLSGQKKRAKDILLNCLIDKGVKRTVRKDMTAVKCVTLQEYKEALKIEKISVSDEPDNVRRVINRVIDNLNIQSITGSYGDYIWFADNTDGQTQTKTNYRDGQDESL